MLSSQDKFILMEMEYTLKALQDVKSRDYSSAYQTAFGGAHTLRPLSMRYANEYIHARCLAMSTIVGNW